MSQSRTENWTIVTVRQSQAFKRPNGRVSIGFWTNEMGSIAFEVNQQAIESLRNNLKDAERLLHRQVGHA
jgi:hypothetical protein